MPTTNDESRLLRLAGSMPLERYMGPERYREIVDLTEKHPDLYVDGTVKAYLESFRTIISRIEDPEDKAHMQEAYDLTVMENLKTLLTDPQFMLRQKINRLRQQVDNDTLRLRLGLS